MKRIIRCMCVVLVFSLLMVTPAFAAENNASRASAFFSKISTYLYPVTGNTFEVWFSVTGTGVMDELGASRITVQRRASSSDSW